MRNVIMSAATVAFFALCLAYVRWCDRIIGADPADHPDDADDEPARGLGVDEVVA